MWLVNAKTFHLKSFTDEERAPPYAILSHTWGDTEEEVSFRDINRWATGKDFKGTKRVGWQKIKNSCAKALEYDYKYIWIDTCCIDKSSSAELQEAINSMFSYYASSGICFVYLVDVGLFDTRCLTFLQKFRHARWFTRGWTLQELLAPVSIEFFNCTWENIGNRDQHKKLISSITGIKIIHLTKPHQAPVAVRMSWVAKRKTTRREDMAYCLLGLFQVHMPLLYGEGDKAFDRLQEEILRSNDDASIHIWGRQGHTGYTEFDLNMESPGDDDMKVNAVDSILLAPHPRFFRITEFSEVLNLHQFKPPSFAMGQRGLTAHLPVKADPNYEGLAWAILNMTNLLHQHLAVPLISVSCGRNFRGGVVHNEYWRPIWCRPIYLPVKFSQGALYEEILIRRRPKEVSHFFNLPFRMNIRCSEKLTLMGFYPPSPVSKMFILFSKDPIERYRAAWNDEGISYGEEAHVGRRFFNLNINTIDRLAVPVLVVVDYRLESEPGHTPWATPNAPTCACILECRVFLIPQEVTELCENKNLSLQSALSFMTRRGPGDWKELPHLWQGNHKYSSLDGFVDGSDTFLDIHVTPGPSGDMPYIGVGLVPRESVTTEEKFLSSTSKRKPWRFFARSFEQIFVAAGSWTDYLNAHPDKDKDVVESALQRKISRPNAQITVFDERGIVEEHTEGSDHGCVPDESDHQRSEEYVTDDHDHGSVEENELDELKIPQWDVPGDEVIDDDDELWYDWYQKTGEDSDRHSTSTTRGHAGGRSGFPN